MAAPFDESTMVGSSSAAASGASGIAPKPDSGPTSPTARAENERAPPKKPQQERQTPEDTPTAASVLQHQHQQQHHRGSDVGMIKGIADVLGRMRLCLHPGTDSATDDDDDDHISTAGSTGADTAAAAAAAAAGCRNCKIPTPVLSIFSSDDDGEADNIGDSVPDLLREIKHDGKSRHTSLQKLHQLTDKEHRRNRLPLICTTKFDVVPALISCLSQDAQGPDRRKALLILANLSIPVENKAVMLLRPLPPQPPATASAVPKSPSISSSPSDGVAATSDCGSGGGDDDDLVSALLRVLKVRSGEAYLAAACLYNLSFLEDAKATMLAWPCRPENAASATKRKKMRQQQQQGKLHDCADGYSSNSFLAILECLIVDYSPYLLPTRTPSNYHSPGGSNGNVNSGGDGSKYSHSPPSVQGEAVRWSMGALRNLVSPGKSDGAGGNHNSGSISNAHLVAQTRVPALAAKLLGASKRELGFWTARDSLEDSCLMLLVHLSSSYCNAGAPSAPLAMKMPSLDVLKPVLDKVRGQGGIHEVRAVALLRQLEEQQQQMRLPTGKGEINSHPEEKKETDSSSTDYNNNHTKRSAAI